jgi:flagellar basal body-associated protein FliL
MGSRKRSNHLVPKGEERLKSELRDDIVSIAGFADPPGEDKGNR